MKRCAAGILFAFLAGAVGRTQTPQTSVRTALSDFFKPGVVFQDRNSDGVVDFANAGLVTTFDLLPNRALAVPERPQLAGLATVSLEWSEATRKSGVFFARQDSSDLPPKDCIGMPRQP